jgi:hypothetical protein
MFVPMVCMVSMVTNAMSTTRSAYSTKLAARSLFVRILDVFLNVIFDALTKSYCHANTVIMIETINFWYPAFRTRNEGDCLEIKSA